MPAYRVASHERSYTIEELADELGVPRSRIHFWSKKRLIDPPSPRTSRYARYSDRHLIQCRAILALQDRRIYLADLSALLREQAISITDYLAQVDPTYA